MAHEPMFECMVPPGSQESHCTIALYMRSAMPARSRISPSMMKRGMATRTYSMAFCHTISPSA